MAGNELNEIKTFVGTRDETKKFLERQITQVGKYWVTRDSNGKIIYLT